MATAMVQAEEQTPIWRVNLSLTAVRFQICGGRVDGGASLGHASCIKEQASNFEEWLFASVKLPSA